MKGRTALAIVLALIVFVGVWVFVYFVEMSNTTRAVVWLEPISKLLGGVDRL